MAVSRFLVVTCKMRFFKPESTSSDIHGSGEAEDELTFMSVHLHHMTAKKEVSNPAAALSGFWDELVEAIVEFRVRIMAGDFNMALWQVVPELRARGVQANLAAWYPWKHHLESSIRIDSTAIFVIGPRDGLRKVFGSDAIIESAVAEDPLPSTWRNVEKIRHDEAGKETPREAWTVPVYSVLGSGFPLSNYRPHVEDRMKEFIRWSFAPALEEDSFAMMGPRT